MKRTLRYFAWVAELLGRDSDDRDLDDGITIAEILDLLAAADGGARTAFTDRSRLRFAIDGEMASADSAIGGAREIAIFPPVTGGM